MKNTRNDDTLQPDDVILKRNRLIATFFLSSCKTNFVFFFVVFLLFNFLLQNAFIGFVSIELQNTLITKKRKEKLLMALVHKNDPERKTIVSEVSLSRIH